MMRAFDSLHSLVHHNLAATIAVMIAYSLGVLVGLGGAVTPDSERSSARRARREQR